MSSQEFLDSVPDPDPWLDTLAQWIYEQLAEILLDKGELTNEKVPVLATSAQTLARYEQLIESDQQPDGDFEISLVRISDRLFKIGIWETDMAAIGMKTPEQLISELSN